MFTKKLAAAAVIALAALPLSAQAQGKFTTMEKHWVQLGSNVSLSWNPLMSSITIRISTGCLSTMDRNVVDRTEVKFIPAAREISIRGGFMRLVAPGDHRRGSADCHGERSRVLTFDNVDRGELAVTHQDEPLWTVDLGDEPADMAAHGLRSKSIGPNGKLIKLPTLENLRALKKTGKVSKGFAKTAMGTPARKSNAPKAAD